MNLDNFNLIGLSMGAPIVMEMASDPNFCRKINDLIAVDPPSIVDKSGKRLVFDFLIREGIPAALDPEQIVKSSFASHRPEMTVSMKGVETVVAPILGRAQITPEKIEQINPKGKFEVWTGGKSSITGNEARRILVEAEGKRRINHPDSSPMRVINVPVHHQNLFSTSGMAEKIIAPDTYSTTEVVINKDELATNGAQAILRGKQFSPSTVS
jgi:pimeloyl-ACP methyl ester carboxylesterase